MANQQVAEFFAAREREGLKLTYDDVRLDSDHSDVLPAQTKLHSRITRNITLKIPIVSSPMDTVTESRMAIDMALAGGMGIIHRVLSPHNQAEEVARAKLYINGFIERPICARKGETVANVLKRRETKGYRFFRFPVLDSKGKLIGLVTEDDFVLCTDKSQPIERIMTPLSKLVTAKAGTTKEQAYALMCKRKKKSLPVVKKDGRLAGMYLFSDLRRIKSGSSMHNIDSNGQLRVGAAVGAGKDFRKRAALLAARGCDVFQIDTAHADSGNVFKAIKFLKKKYPHIDVLAGNVSNGRAAKRLAETGVDGILVGQGPGSICTTRMIAGIGVPQVSAVYDCVRALEGTGIPVCADGGITNSGDIVIALAVGAESVMLGRVLSGTDESPGEVLLVRNVKKKLYRGMGSLGAMRASRSLRDRYKQSSDQKLVPEGIEGIVDYQGSVVEVLAQNVGGVRSGFGYIGAKDLSSLRERASIFRITNSGLKESRPHDVAMTDLPPNYRGDRS